MSGNLKTTAPPQIGGKELAKLRKTMIDPTRNHRLRLKKLRPQEQYCIVRVDPPKTQTDGGIVLPGGNEGIAGQFAGAPVGRDQKGFQFDMTAVVVAIGPDVENVEVGERVMLPVPPIPVRVADPEEEHPLGLLDSRDIICKVEG